MKIKNIKNIENFFYEYPQSLNIIKNVTKKDYKLGKKLIKKIDEGKIKNIEEIVKEIKIYEKNRRILNYFYNFFSTFLYLFIFLSYPKMLYNPEINKNKIEKINIEFVNFKNYKKIEFENYLNYYRITSKFGEERKNTVIGGWNKKKRKHEGIDLAPNKKEDKIIKAFTDGIVFYRGYTSGYGKFLITQHEIDGKLFGENEKLYLYCFYAHCAKIYVKNKDSIKLGDKIAYMGKSGEANGIHLHFETRISKNKLKSLDEYFKLLPQNPKEIIEKLEK